jgi:hypothetical protein
MILESTMERKNLNDSIMRRYKDTSNVRTASRSKDSDTKKRPSLYQNFVNKRVSASKDSGENMSDWGTSSLGAPKKNSDLIKKSEPVDKILNNGSNSIYKTDSDMKIRKTRSGAIYHSHNEEK